ncbi:unnamed protein product [Orchesella dallaii]|uniref:C2H2-type domain-containing protein n=1 Tax=Orchesella dallaii TaxID=48710 RepID=A0ABP1RV75_9HEXA
MLQISQSIYANEDEENEEEPPLPPPSQDQSLAPQEEKRQGDESGPPKNKAGPELNLNQSDKFVPVPVKTEILEYLEGERDKDDEDEEEDTLFMRRIFENSCDFEDEEEASNNGNSYSNSTLSSVENEDGDDNDDDQDWTASSKKKPSNRGRKGRKLRGSGGIRGRKRVTKISRLKLPSEKVEAERLRARERMRVRRTEERLQRGLEPGVKVKIEPTSENEENEDDYSHFDELNLDPKPKRMSRRAAAANVKREQYRELDSDDDGYEYYPTDLDLGEKPRARGRSRKIVTRKVSGETKSSRSSSKSSFYIPPDLPKEEREALIKARNREQTRKYRERKRQEMTEEEWMAEKARLAERQKQLRQEKGSRSGSGSLSTKTEPSSDTDELSTSKGKGGGGRYKPISEMTEEEKEKVREQRKNKQRAQRGREEDRIRKQQRREAMTEKEREEVLRKQREQKRARRAAMTPAEREIYREREREQKKLKRMQMTAEEKKEESQKKTMRRIELLAQMTDEERAQFKQSRYIQYLTHKASMTPEEMERRKQLRKEKSRARYQALTEEQKKIIMEKQKQWRCSLAGERRQRYLDKLKEAYNRRVERLKEDPEKWEEMQSKVREYKQKRKEHALANEKPGDRKKKRKIMPWIPGESKESREKRVLETRRLRDKKQRIKRKVAYQNLLDSGLTMEEIRNQMETPEQREHRLIKARINFAKRNLRERLSKHGAPPDEIDARIEEFVASYQPRPVFRPYKPRPDNCRPLQPEDIKLIQEDLQFQAASSNSKEANVREPSSLESSPKRGGNTSRRGRKPKTSQNQARSQSESSSFVPLPSTSTSTPLTLSSTSAILGQARSQPSATSSSPSTAINLSMPQMASYSTPLLSPSSSTMSTSSFPSTSHTRSEHEPYHHQYHHQYVHNLPQESHYNPYQALGAASHYHPHQPPPPYLMHQTPMQNYQAQPLNMFDSSLHPFQPQNQMHPAYHQDDYSSSTGYDRAAQLDDDDNHGDHFDSDNKNDVEDRSRPTFMPPPPPQIPMKRGAKGRGPGRPRKHDNNKVEGEAKPTPRKGRGTPRGPFQGKDPKVKRDQVCEVCGNAYTIKYISEHKQMYHNPHYVDGKCTLCEGDVSFASGLNFFKHYIKVHKPNKYNRVDGKERNWVCDTCGEMFRSLDGLQKHEYYRHGDGNKKENFKKCPHCEKEMKSQVTLNNHIRTVHGGIGLNLYECLRCDQKFGLTKELKEHVGEAHPEAYFPCEDCSVLKYTQASLMFHQNYCPKRPIEKKREGRVKVEKYVGIERLQVECEICQKSLTLFSLSRHYKETHGVIDELFTCMKCPKKFKRREWWVTHMEMVHSILPKEVKEEIARYNVGDRSKVEIVNYGRRNVQKGREGGKSGSGSGASSRRGTGRGRSRGGGGRGRGRPRIQRRSHSSDEEESDFSKEDEEEDDSDDEEWRYSNNKKKKTGQDKKGRAQRFKKQRVPHTIPQQLHEIERERRLVILVEPLTPDQLAAYLQRDIEARIRKAVGKVVVEPEIGEVKSEVDDDEEDSEDVVEEEEETGAQARREQVLDAAVASIANLHDDDRKDEENGD